jgi:hypothetical protein
MGALEGFCPHLFIRRAEVCFCAVSSSCSQPGIVELGIVTGDIFTSLFPQFQKIQMVWIIQQSPVKNPWFLNWGS